MRRKNTKIVNVKYTEIIDLQTVAGKTSIIGIHTPCTEAPIKRLFGLYRNYSSVRYNGCSVVMAPAANLPVDPLGLTGVVGTTDLMDPRDALNPFLFHGCHGEHLGQILDSVYGASERHAAVSDPIDIETSSSAAKVDVPNATVEALSRYYQCLTDTSWRKYGIQSVFKKRLYPLVNKMVASNPILPYLSGNMDVSTEVGKLLSLQTSEDNEPVQGFDPNNAINTNEHVKGIVDVTQGTTFESGTSVRYTPYLYTSGVTRMGWLPTSVNVPGGVRVALIPKQFMGILVMPPSYNVEQFFRMSIQHSFSFKDFTTSTALSEIDAPTVDPNDNSYFNWIDYDVTSV